jgi:hypothetical protein
VLMVRWDLRVFKSKGTITFFDGKGSVIKKLYT